MEKLQSTFNLIIKKLIISLLFLYISNVFAEEGDLYKVSLSEKVQNSEFIFFGKVLQKVSYKDTDGLIYTRNTIAVLKSYKGELETENVIIRTVGGIVGNENLSTSCLLTLEENEKGVFFCNSLNGSMLSVYSSMQGFLYFDRATNQVGCPFYKASWTSFQEDISSLLGVSSITITNPIPQLIFAIGGDEIYIHPTVITAGTESILTIYGKDFGNVQPSATSYVEFTSADEGAPNYYAPPLQNYITWSDTIIKVLVPSRAGTGWPRVYNDSLIGYSNERLIIPFAITNIGDTLQNRMIDQNGSGGRTWSFNTAMFGGLEEQAFTRAVDTWNCGTGMNYSISPTPTSANSSANDGVNAVFYSNSLATGVLGVCYTWSGTCGGTDFRIVDTDIAFRSSTNWAYGPAPPGSMEMDFESTALHEIGHSHGLGHVIDTGDPMEYASASGDSSRFLFPGNIFGTQYMINRSQSTNSCGEDGHQQVYAPLCTNPNKTDAWLKSLTYFINDSTCYANQNVPVQISNLGADTISTLDLGWSVNGVFQGNVSYSTYLGLSELDTFSLGSYNFQDSLYEVEVWVNSVNGLQEIDRTNDTVSYIFQTVGCQPDDASIRIATKFANYRCYGNDSLYVNLFNKGTNDLSSCKIYAELNGVLVDSLLWTGLIAPRDTLFDLLLVEFQNIDINNMNDIRVWTAAPNGVQDSYLNNDTTGYSFLASSLIGHYTLGGSNPDFADLITVFDTIQQYGICGDIVLNIRDGVYANLGFVFPLPGNSHDHSILIKSESNSASSVTLNSSTSRFRGIQNVTLKHISFDTCWVEIDEGTSNFIIDSCLFNQSSFRIINNNDNLTADTVIFTNNIVLNGQIKTHTQDYDSIANYILIQGNTIDPLYTQAAIDISYYEKVECLDNIILNNQPQSIGTGDLIDLLFNKDSVIFAGNKVYNSKRYKTIKFWGGSDLTVLMYNNEFSSINTNPNFTYNQIVSTSGLGRFEIYNNSFDFYSIYNNNTNSIFTFQSTDSAFLRNNTYRVDGIGYIYYFQNSSTYFDSDYNSFWSNYDISKRITTVQSSFQDYQAFYNMDLNSHELDPEYFSSNRLKPTNININNQGVSLPLINTDIDGTLRGNPPDIGAYEFDALNYDIKINDYLNVRDSSFCAGDSSEVVISLYNNGLLPIDSFKIYYSFNDEPFDTISRYLNIPPGDSALCSLGIHDFYLPYSNAIVISDLPNGTVDTNFNNNSGEWMLFTKLDGEYTVGDSISDFVTLQHAFEVLALGICGPVTFNLKPGVHEDPGELGKIEGNNDQNKITLQSLSSDTSDTYILNNSDHFYLNGVKFLSFKNLSFEGDIVIDSIQGGVFDTCSFNNVQFLSTESIETEFIDSLIIRHSKFQNSVFDFQELIDIRWFEIAHNTFKGNSAIYFEGTYNTIQYLHYQDIRIHHNEVDVFLTLNPLQEFIFIQGCDGFLIHNNNINCPTRSAIELKTNLYGNNRVYNNFIKSNWHPFLLQNNAGLFIDHNTMFTRGVNFYSNPSVTFRNNILYFNPAYNSGLDEYFYYFNFTNTHGLDDLTADGNLFYGDVSIFVHEVGEPTLSLGSWRSLYQSDLNSVVGDPMFIVPDDMHVNSQLADNSGIDLSTMAILEDIDDEPRSLTTPDIGADEFTYDPNMNYGVQIDSLIQPIIGLCQDQDTVIASVTNNSSDTIFSLELLLYVDGALINTIIWNDTLLTNQTVQLYFGQYNFMLDSTYQIDIEANQIDNPFFNLNGVLTATLSGSEGIHIEYGSDILCGADSTFLTTNWVGSQHSFLWSTGSSADTIWVDYTSQIEVEGLTIDGCVSSDSVQINAYQSPTPVQLNYSDTAVCFGDTIHVEIQPEIVSNSYQWNLIPDDTSALYITDSTLLSVIVTDSNGCKQILNQDFYVNDNPDITIVQVDDTTIAVVSNDQNIVDYTWYFGGNIIPSETDSIMYADQNGAYTVEVINSEGCTSISNPINIVHVGLSGELDKGIHIYPNPVNDVLRIDFTGINGLKLVKIFDLQGKLIQENELSSDSGVIDIKHFAKGLYQLQIWTESKVYDYRIMKK